MIHVWSELLVYVIKFLSMLVCAGLGIMVGKKIRKNKDVKIQERLPDVKLCRHMFLHRYRRWICRNRS